MATPGTSFRELINYTTGKSNASREDLESSLAAKGYKPSDIRKIGRGYDRVSSSGDEYTLHPEKGFNVSSSSGQLKTGSGKRKGNKSGSDLGDLIGLGNDVSLLAGALRNELPGYTQSKQPSPTITPEATATSPTQPAAPEFDTPVKVKKSSTTTKKAGSKSTPTKAGSSFDPNFDASKYKLNFKLEGPEPSRSKSAEGSGKSVKEERQYPNLDGDSFFDMGGFSSLNGFSDLTNKTKNDLITLGQVGSFAGPFHQRASKFYNKALLPLQLMGVGVNMGADALNPDRDIDWSQAGDDLTDIGVSTIGANATNLLRGAGKALKNGKNSIGDYFRKSTNSKLKFPQVENQYEPGFGRPGSPEFFPEGGYRDGGSLPLAKDGLKLGEGDEFDWNQYAPQDFGPEFFDSKIQSFPGDGGTQGEIAPQSGAEYGEITPGKGGSSRPGKYGDILAGLVKYGVPAAYLAAEHNQIGRLRGMINPHLEAPELMTGSVQDLAKPDFSLPYRPDQQGSSLTESQNSGLARDKYSRDARNNYELQNSMFRQEQKNAIVDRTNQAAIQRAGIKNQENMIKSSNAYNEFAYMMNDRGVTASSLFNNLDQGIYGAQVTHDARQLSHAQDVIKNPERYPNDQTWARKVLSGNKRKGGTLKSKFSKAMC